MDLQTEVGRLRRDPTLPFPRGLGNGNILFVWEGEADAVRLLTWMPTFPEPAEFSPVDGAFALVLPLPDTAMIEYRLGIRRGRRTEAILDPLNPVTTTNPFGINSVATGPGYRRPPWTLPDPTVPAGLISEVRVTSDVWGGERRHHKVYRPAAGGEGPLPALVVHDGSDFLDHAALAAVLDNLISAGDLPPLVAILHDPRHRLEEYADDDRHALHVIDELIPHVARRVALDGRVFALGSSLGAAAALSLLTRHPDMVAGAALLSGSLPARFDSHRPAEIFTPVVNLVRSLGSGTIEHKPVYVSCGRYEGLIDLNRALAPRLRAAGARLRYEETWEGHQWASWRDRLRPALCHILE